MAIILETQNLISRKFTLEDAEFILELLNSEGWLKYIGDRNVKTKEQAEAYLLNGPLKPGNSPFPFLSLVALKTYGTPIGLLSLIKRDDLEFVDIGFAFLPQFTGNGYAFEILSETIRFAFNTFQLEKIIAITLPENERSIRLLEKLGMQLEGNYIKKESGECLLKYGLSNNLK